MINNLRMAECGALALDVVAAALDESKDARTFVCALERNNRVWRLLSDVAVRRNWKFPDRRQSRFALGIDAGARSNDDLIHALVTVNRRVAAALSGGDIERIRQRARCLWEERGRPQGQDLDIWLLAEMEEKAAHPLEAAE